MDPVASSLPYYQQHSWCRRTLGVIVSVTFFSFAFLPCLPMGICVAQAPIELLYLGTAEDFEDLDFTITNAYSGEQEVILGNYYVQNREFRGGESDLDSVRAFGFDDAILLTGVPVSGGTGIGEQMFFDLEVFNLDIGNNILNFASTEIDYGDMQVNASHGNDIIWTNIGNDVINSGDGDDIVDAGPGDDEIHAGTGADEIRGGLGSDQLFGESGADTLYFSADNTWSPTDNGNVSNGIKIAATPA